MQIATGRAASPAAGSNLKLGSPRSDYFMRLNTHFFFHYMNFTRKVTIDQSDYQTWQYTVRPYGPYLLGRPLPISVSRTADQHPIGWFVLLSSDWHFRPPLAK